MRAHFHSFRARALLACVPATAMVLMGAAGTASAAHRPANSRAELRTALQHLLAGWHPSTHGAHWASLRGTGLKQVTRSNWSGYADDNSGGNTYRKVSGRWTEPRITCASKELQVAVFWVGIDGFANSTVEQDGTIAECYLGKAHYYSWWEMYPTNFIQVVGTTVKPGDHIAGSVAVSGTKYTLKLTDSTTRGNNVSKTQTCTSCANTSAEWIAETPSQARGYTPLPDFKTWTVSSASVTSAKTGGIKAFPDDQITLVGAGGIVQRGYALATPGALNAAGTRFSVTWHNSY